MLVDVAHVTPNQDYHLDLVFKNGEHRRFDMRPLLAVKPWNKITSKQMFDYVTVQHGIVTWPNGLDIAPETVYLDSVPVGQ